MSVCVCVWGCVGISDTQSRGVKTYRPLLYKRGWHGMQLEWCRVCRRKVQYKRLEWDIYGVGSEN